MNKRIAVVMTTINEPFVLDSYARNAEKYGRSDDVWMIIIGDRKTPDTVRDMAAAASRAGFETDYVDIARQEDWLKRFPDMAARIPYNTDNRRNIGFLMALERGCEVLISIDDDNLCPDDEDYFGRHAIVGTEQTMPTISSDTGWFNICSMMDNSHGASIYPRGYPYSKRTRKEQLTETSSTGLVAVNAGLWTLDPDIDAVTRLNEDVKTLRMNRDSVMLAPGTWSPVNTQNTAIWAEAMPAYYYVLMGEPVHGARLDRYGDIWSGYFIGKCVQHLDHRIAVGTPVARHERNSHNLLLDLRQELWGMILTESLTEILQRITLTGSTYTDAYEDLARKLDAEIAVCEDPNFTPDVRAYFAKITATMRVWLDVCRDLAAAPSTATT